MLVISKIHETSTCNISTKCKYWLRLKTFTVGGGSSLQQLYVYIVSKKLGKFQEMRRVESILCKIEHCVQHVQTFSYWFPY